MGSAANLHQSGLMGNMSVKIEDNTQEYIAAKACPIVPVKKESDDYVIFLKSFWYRNYAKLIPDGDRTPVANYGTDSAGYRCKDYGIAARITKREKENADAIYRLMFNKNSFVTTNILRKRELLTAALMFNASNFTNTSVPSVKWDNASGLPVTDILAGMEAVADAIGIDPNTIIIGRKVMKALKRNPEMIAALYGSAGNKPQIMHTQDLAGYFEVAQFLNGKGKYTTDPEGTAEASVTYTDIWTDMCWIGYVAPQPAIETPSACYTFRKRRQIRVWDEKSTENTYIDGKDLADTKLVSADAGYLFTDVLA